MKPTLKLISLVLCTTLLGSACEKQASQQSQVNAKNSDARTDISNQPSPTSPATSPSGDSPVTVNPNSDRSSPDSTLGTQQGASVVGNANMNPSSPSSVPTSVDDQAGREPRADAAVDNVNCLDAANTKDGSSVGIRNDCPPTAQSRIKDADTAKEATR